MKNKKLISTVLLATMCFSTGLIADSVTTEIKAHLRKDISVTKNYQKYWLNDGNGKTVFPLTYEGKVYLPVRAVGDMLGAGITWDETNKRINVEPKVNVQYVQIPAECNHKDDEDKGSSSSNSSNKGVSYKDLSSSDKKKVDGYEDKIEELEKKISRHEDKLDDLYDDEDDAEDDYDYSGSSSDRDKLNKIRDDIKYYEKQIDKLEDEIDDLEDKIDDIYYSYKRKK